MAETKCEFDLLQRVTIPNGDDIIGVIVGRNESIEAPPMYSMQWTGLKGRTEYGTFAERELQNFNPPPAVRAALSAAFAPVPPSVGEKIAAVRKRKPVRKSKSKKRK